MPSSLCEFCRSVLVNRDLNKYKKGKPTEPIFTTFNLLEKSAADGCLMCSQLLNEFSPQDWERCREAAQITTKIEENKSAVRFNFERRYGPEINFSVQFEFPHASLSRPRLVLLPAECKYDTSTVFSKHIV
jgi:hypothetical protein